MVGRFRDLSVYTEIFKSRDFARILVGAALIPAGYWLVGVDGGGLPVSIPGPLRALFEGTTPLSLLLLFSVALNGLPIIAGAIRGIVEKKVNVDELVSIAIVACLLTGNLLEAALISLIMVLGAFIEEAVSDRARGAIAGLVAVNPQTALVEADGQQILRKIDAVKVGDVVVVKAGEIVPVDGSIIEGGGAIDESVLTGEPIPVFRTQGDDLSAGTLNIDGYLRLEVKKTGKDATIGRIIQLVAEAENSRGRSTRIVDRYAAWFTPVILTIAVMTYLFSGEVGRSIAVLVVGCPCAFLLAGPVSTVAAVGRAAKAGIMVKGGIHLETLARARAFYFDKTGTLTAGKPVVTAIRPAPGATDERVLELAMAVERGSTHPIAAAIAAKGAEIGAAPMAAEDIAVVAGRGVGGTVDGEAVFVSAGETGGSGGHTTVRVTAGGVLAGQIDFFDRIRPEAAQAINGLRDLGAEKIAIVSGDCQAAVEKVAAALQISEYHFRKTPEEKQQILKKELLEGVVFTGDGINDAPCLKSSGVGIAMGSRGAQVALDTADIVLMNDKIALLPFLVRLSRRMTRIIRIDIALSFMINGIAVGLGAMGLLSPIMGAVVHNIGSVMVVMLSFCIVLTRDSENGEEEG